MRNRRQNFVFDPVSVEQDPFLLAARAELPGLAGKGQQVIVAAAVTVDAGKALVKIPAVDKALQDMVLLGSRVNITIAKNSAAGRRMTKIGVWVRSDFKRRLSARPLP